jgi:hypothetical protein
VLTGGIADANLTMTNVAKIAFVGATSMSFGLSMLRDVMSSRELKGCTLALVGRDAAKLSRMADVARLLNERTGAGLKIEHQHRSPRGARRALPSWSMRRPSTAIGCGSSISMCRESTASVTRWVKMAGRAAFSSRSAPCH